MNQPNVAIMESGPDLGDDLVGTLGQVVPGAAEDRPAGQYQGVLPLPVPPKALRGCCPVSRGGKRRRSRRRAAPAEVAIMCLPQRIEADPALQRVIDQLDRSF